MLPQIIDCFADSLNEECGVFGVYNHPDAAAITALGLHALQHRGQEAAGIITRNNGIFNIHYAEGKVGDNFNNSTIIKKLLGEYAIGHVRYSTTGESNIHNIQPLFSEKNKFALAHNGNLTNAQNLKEQLTIKGCIFKSTTDTEVVLHLMELSNKLNTIDKLQDALTEIEGAYSLILLDENQLIGVRDPLGVRPLVLGKLNDRYILASETCALDIINADFIRDIEPGEIVSICNNNVTTITKIKSPHSEKSRFCIFEYIYFSRPDSIIENRSVYEVRKKIGKILAQESHIDADVIVPIPDSGVPAAIGYAQESGLPFELGIIRNHYIGRTFIEPTEQVRNLGVKLKHNANASVLKGKRVILVDDSIVRGTTSKKIVEIVRNEGAKEVHLRISSPPTISPCFYGVDTPDKTKLMAANYKIEEMCKMIGADSLAFISIDGLYKAVDNIARDNNSPSFCDACFTGDYPIPLIDNPNITNK